MNWILDKKRPICPQICEQLSVKIASGEFKPDERLLSVREVALEAGVNPNTVQKAFEQLNMQGLIYSVRGSGWYVSGNIDTAKETVDKIIKSKTAEYFSEMQKMGLSHNEIINYVKEWNENE